MPTVRIKVKSKGPDRTVAARWTPMLAGEGFTPVSDFFLKNYHRLPKPLRPTEAMLVIHLMSFKWDKAAPFPGFKRLAEYMGITPAGVRTHARTLEKKGYLKREMQVGTTNKFHLDGLFKALEKLKKSDEEAELGRAKLNRLKKLMEED